MSQCGVITWEVVEVLERGLEGERGKGFYKGNRNGEKSALCGVYRGEREGSGKLNQLWSDFSTRNGRVEKEKCFGEIF